jgi:hypothetical protein
MLPHHISSYLRQTNEGARSGLTPSEPQTEWRPVSEMSTDDRHGPGDYEIRLKGHLSSRWVTWFDGLTLTNESDGSTVIHGPVVDQAALHGLLQKLRDTGLPLVSVTQVEADSFDPLHLEGTP